jgi:hypothetical protein
VREGAVIVHGASVTAFIEALRPRR